MRVRVLMISFAAFLGGPLSAAEIEPVSRIDSVMLHPDAAVVTRSAEMDLAQGPNTVILRGLPATIDPSSIRIEGSGDAAFSIVSLEVRAAPSEVRPTSDPKLEQKLTALKHEAQAVAGRIEALERKKAMIIVYAEASPEKLSSEAKPLDISQWPAAWNAISAGMMDVNVELSSHQRRAADLKEEIASLEAARPAPFGAGAPKRDLAVALQSSTALRGNLRITYRIDGASWTPLYDAHLSTGDTGVKPALTLTRRASLSQNTGENWENVRLAVSTVSADRGTAAPEVNPVQARLSNPHQARAERGRSSPPPAPTGRLLRYSESAADVAETAPAAALAPRVEAQERDADLEGTAFTVVFSIPGRVSVPSDGSVRTFLIGSKDFEPTILAESAPVLDASAYIETSFVLEDEAPIFAGAVTLQRDGVLVGRSELPLVAPGDEVELGFGVDDRIKVTRTPLDREASEPGLFGSNKTDVRRFKTVVKNLHDHPVRVRIVDRMPYSEDAAVIVEMASESTPPTQTNIKERRGVVSWTIDVPEKAEKEIRFGFSVKWPADRRLNIAP